MSKKTILAPNAKSAAAVKAAATRAAKAAETAAAAAAETARLEAETAAAKAFSAYKSPELAFVRIAEAGKGGGVYAPVTAGTSVVRRKVYAYSVSGAAFVAYAGGFARVYLNAEKNGFNLPLPVESPRNI